MRSMPSHFNRLGRILLFILVVAFILSGTVGFTRSSAANLVVIHRVDGRRALLDARTAAASESILYSFKSDVAYPKVVDGAEPSAGLVADASGSLYGTTSIGGLESSATGDLGNGTVFKLTLSGGQYHETIIHMFNPAVDGYSPNGPLIIDKAGALYGTASGGGLKSCPAASDSTCGIVFKLTPSGTGYVETIIYAFPGRGNGGIPAAGLTTDSSGAFYGTTASAGTACTLGGSNGCGVVFKLTPSKTGYSEKILHSFTGSNDGYYPSGPLTIDARGAIHGTTQLGGSGNCLYAGFKLGCGIVFKLSASGSGFAESVYSFPSAAAGFEPSCGVIEDATGALYGTTQDGGSSGNGNVFKLTLSGSTYTERVLYSFNGAAKNDGASPQGLLATSSGVLYGTASLGGADQGGAIFDLVPSGTAYAEHILYSFNYTTTSPDGFEPVGSLIADKSGSLYGMTSAGGAYAGSYDCVIYGACGGAVFKLTL